MIDSILIIIVIYEIKLDASQAFNSLTEALIKGNQRASLFIYDNSLLPQPTPTRNIWNIYYQHDKSNPGVSKAYNQGFIKAKEFGKKWIMLSDQDSHFPIDFFDCFAKSLATKPYNELFVPILRSGSILVSPFKFKYGSGHILQKIEAKSYPLNDLKFINSGLIVSTLLFEKCGGYDERFELDFSDLAFIERLKKYQEEFLVMNATCEHHLSSQEKGFSKAKNRFNSFLKASRLFGYTFGPSVFLFINRLFRAIKLSLRFRSFEFLKLLIQIQ
jgi:GT2 family glycosyltransferase